MTYLTKEIHFGFLSHNMGCPVGSDDKNLPATGQEDHWRREWLIHSSQSTGNAIIFACTIPWTEELGRVMSTQYMQISTLRRLIKI